MISNFLLLISIGLVFFSYLLLFVKWILHQREEINNYSVFDVAKEITSDYDSINIVSSNDVIFSEYDIKRNVIRLVNKKYDSNKCFDVAVASLLAGYSLVEKDNNKYFAFKSVIKKISYINLVSLIDVILSCLINTVGDAKIGVVVSLLLVIYQYMKYQINIMASDIIKEKLDNDVYESIDKVISSIISINKLSFIVMLILILRLLVIILGI